jgi:hypothetical protein
MKTKHSLSAVLSDGYFDGMFDFRFRRDDRVELISNCDADRSDHATLLVEEADKHGFVREFIEMGLPEAVHLRRILRLAEKIEDAGWSPDDPPTEDFWEIMPPKSD